MFAAEIRKKRVAHMRGYPQWRWHLDEVFVRSTASSAISGAPSIMKARFWKRSSLRAGQGRGAEVSRARDEDICQEVGRRLNNRAENSHQPFRRREHAMQRLRSMKTLQKFSSVHAEVHNHFNQERHLVTRQVYKQRRAGALAEWRALAA
jgi:putative transposase